MKNDKNTLTLNTMHRFATPKFFSLLLVQVLCLGLVAQPQTEYFVNTDWQNNSGKVGKYSSSNSTLDSYGNLITVSNTLNINQKTDILVIKTDPNGTELWRKTYNGSGNGDDYGVQVQTDSYNNIVIVAAEATSVNKDIAVLKYHPTGVLLWHTTWNGPAALNDFPTNLAVDLAGDVLFSWQYGSQQ